MESKKPTSLLVISFLTILSFCVVETQCRKNQAEQLGHFYKAKLSNSGIETGSFRAIHHVDSAKIHPQEGLKEQDRIERLPGQPQVEFSQYGGYVTVDKSAGRALYYYFAESEKRKSNESLPLLLWLNGGPGCSSLAYGAMQELGPFRVHSDGKTLYRNRYSWNNAANVLFLESPAGVGFSYSNTTSDYGKNGDSRTAEDSYVFMVNWLERFPEYKGREFYISGESYAGHYVPQLASTILHHNKLANKTIINLKGIIIGNAVINDETDERGMYDYFASHALISDEDNHKVRKHCDFSPNASTSNLCDAITEEIYKIISYINIYSIYAPLCFNTDLTSRPKKTSIMNFDPCSDYYVYAYLNRPEVQAAMHANVTKLDHDWEPCSDVITKWNDSPSTIIPLLEEFMSSGIRVWVFSLWVVEEIERIGHNSSRMAISSESTGSQAPTRIRTAWIGGDTDGRVPVTSTKYSINKMKLDVKTAWHAWYLGGEVGGFTQVYKGDLTLATVRGAGHQVPSYQPKRALSLIWHFLGGSPLPDTTRYD